MLAGKVYSGRLVRPALFGGSPEWTAGVRRHPTAVVATAVVLLVEAVLIRLEFKLTSKSTDLTLYIEYAHAVCMESVLALLRERRVQIENLEISRIADTDAPDAPHHYCALIPIHSRAPLRPGDLRNDLTALPDILTVEEM